MHGGRLRVLVALGFSVVTAAWLVSAAAADSSTRTIVSSGVTQFQPTAQGADGVQANEIDSSMLEPDGTPVVNRSRPGEKHAKFPKHPLDAPVVASSAVATSNPELGPSFNGLNHRDQRLAAGGNQFSLEPPDQGLCAGNGFVLEVINDVIRVFSTTGAPVTDAQDLNSFYHYPPAIIRASGTFGPFLTDPVCYFDPELQHWIVAELTLDRVGTTSRLSGKNHLDIAVSTGPTPAGAWKIYKIPVQDDGTDGTPTHANCPCIGDYPHIGADANGVYLTTNEYSFFGDGYNGAQIYAFSKAFLESGAMSVPVTQVENTSVDGIPGFTVWPATSPAGQYSSENGGTEFFLSSIAGAGSETGNPTGTAKRIALWSLSNTASLNSASPSLVLGSKLIKSETYVFPPKANQKPGDFPLGQCINDTTTVVTSLGPPFTGCWKAFFNSEPAHNEVESTPDSNDTRMQQVTYSGGLLYGALDTAVIVGGDAKAGVAWFAVKPKVNGDGKAEGKVVNQGYVALAGNNLTYPAIAVLPNGKGVMAFSLLGNDFYPSAGYATLDATNGVGALHVAAPGLGPADGFTSYKAFVGNPPRTRWGDYGAAVVVGSDIWIASEYIGQTCTLAQYTAPPFGSCGGTRTSLGNWYTRISKVTP